MFQTGSQASRRLALGKGAESLQAGTVARHTVGSAGATFLHYSNCLVKVPGSAPKGSWVFWYTFVGSSWNLEYSPNPIQWHQLRLFRFDSSSSICLGTNRKTGLLPSAFESSRVFIRSLCSCVRPPLVRGNRTPLSNAYCDLVRTSHFKYKTLE